MFLFYLAYQYPPWLISCARRDLYQRRVEPKRLSFLEIEAVFALVLGALVGIVLEIHKSWIQ